MEGFGAMTLFRMAYTVLFWEQSMKLKMMRSINKNIPELLFVQPRDMHLVGES